MGIILNNKGKMKKKAILFSLISVLMSILFITLFSQTFSTVLEDRIPGSNIRIKVIDVYTRNFENYASESIKISTYRVLESLTSRGSSQGFYTDQNDFNRKFYNCMTCGTFDCSGSVLQQCPMGTSGYDLNSRMKNISDLSLAQLNIKTEYKIHNVTIRQDYPFEVEVTINISYNITDNSGSGYYAKWIKNKVITQSVSIIELTDPLANISSYGNVSRKITKYNGVCVFNETCWNLANTITFYNSNDYRYYVGGVGFLQRYWNDLTPSSCCGLERIMHPTEFKTAFPVYRNNSYIDHYYWNGTNNCSFGKILNYTFNGDSVSLDEETAARYKISSYGTELCKP